MEVNCPDCDTGMSVLKTLALGSVTQRLRECECGVRVLTTETISRRIGAVGSKVIQLPVSPVDARQPPGNRQATAPQPSGGVGGGLSSGSDPVLFPDPNPDVVDHPNRACARNKSRAEAPAEFVAFWALYPRHVAKAAALKAWIKIDPTSELIQAITAAISWQRVDFLARDPDKVPHAATWLNQRRWEDERPTVSRPPATNLGPRSQRNLGNFAAVLERHRGEENGNGNPGTNGAGHRDAVGVLPVGTVGTGDRGVPDGRR